MCNAANEMNTREIEARSHHGSENSSSKPLRIGILGAAGIARAFVNGVRPSTLISVTAVASRNIAKAESFARECGVERALGSYEALLADPKIDAIYNPLPNTMHAKWSIRATESGKHVLCEKPFAATAADARLMFDAARRNNVYVVEAFPYLAQPQTLKLRELVSSGTIGKIKLITCSFGVPIADPANIRQKPDLGGGAVLDAGSYSASFVRVLAGERPDCVTAVARWSETGVENTVVANLEFANGLLAQISCSLATAWHRHGMIVGDIGVIETTYLNNPPLGGLPILTVRTGAMPSEPKTIEVAGGNGFLAEAESFQKLVTLGTDYWTGATPEESIDVALILDAIRQSVRSGMPVKVSQ